MKRSSGNTLALAGLFLGLTVGLCLMLFKQWLVNEIVGALEDEVHAACDCSLTFDSFNLSFSTLSGRARNIRILEKGQPKLTFKDITAEVDLSQIREKKVSLTRVILSEGIADGVGPDSATFRFIDQLTTPLPPEKQRPDRWRVVLETLEIQDSFLREPFGSSEISGSSVSLFVKRIGENFSLLPRVEDLRYTSYGSKPGEPPSELFLGALSGSLVIEDSKTVFNSLTLGDNTSRVDAKAELDSDHGNQLSGSTTLEMSPSYIGLPDWLQGSFTGATSITGPIGSPVLTGSVAGSPTHPMTLAFPNASEVPLSSMTAKLQVDLNHGSPIVSLDTIIGAAENTSLKSTQPLIFSDDGLSAGFDVSIPTFTYGPFTIKNAKARISVKQGPAGTTTDFDITTEDLQLQGFSLGPNKISIQLDPKSVDVVADSTNPRQGALHWKGLIDISGSEATLQGGLLRLESYRYPTKIPADDESLAPIAVTTSMSLKGPLDLARLSGEGETTVSFPAAPSGFPLRGKTTLKDGLLKVSLPDSSYKGTAELNVDFVKTRGGKLRLVLPPQKASALFTESECGLVGANLTYSFQLEQILLGSGELGIDAFELGCAPYALVLPKNTKIPIRNGALAIRELPVSTLESILVLNGELGIDRGFDLSAKGKLQLSSLIPFLPSIDDLNGLLKADMSIKGPLSSPLFNGTAQLSNGEFGLSSPDLGAHDIQGAFTLAGSHVKIDKLVGSVNNGTFAIKGSLLPFDWAHSDLTANLNEVTIEPLQDASITFSGDLRLGLSNLKRQMLSGQIVINFAEIAKDFDLNKILINAISGYFLPTRAQPTATKKKVDIELNVGISAPRNIFVLTPFFSAELNTQIHAGGTISEPALAGSMQVLTGWVGVKGNRFDITSGGLTFKPGSIMPTIEIASEGTLRTATGENILVTLEASGPLQNPKIELSSDRGLSQGDILLLLTSSRRLGGSTQANRLGSQFNLDQRYFISQDSFSSFQSFFRNLARIDTLSFEPAYNQFTGTIEPAVVARKNVSPRLTLLGESLFSSVSNSRAGAVYSLTPKLNVNAFFQTVSTQRSSIVSSDLTYTILSEQSEFVTFTIEGLKEFDEQSILASARLGTASRILNTDEGLRSIERQIENYMHDQGYRQASAAISCTRGERYCYQILMKIQEGSPSTIADIVFERDPLPDNLVKIVQDTAPSGTLATSTVTDTIERKIVLALRNEGFISARITPSYRIHGSSSKVTLVVSADIREPISFVFKGNTVFSAKDFLDSIDLFSRRRSFGNNTIKLLVQNIEQMYQERGYLFVQVTYTEDRTNPERLTYVVNIAEEAPTKVQEVTLSGNTNITRKRLVEIMNELGLADQARLLHPMYAVPNQLDTLRDAILTAYQEEGFPEASVSYQIIPDKTGEHLTIAYEIHEGTPRRTHAISVEGYPKDLRPLPRPTIPASIPRVNVFVEDLIETLRSEGYLFPTVALDPTDTFDSLTIIIDPGPRTFISSVTYEGLADIPEETARRDTAIQVGHPYRTEDVNITKRKLLRSGLFSRVEVVAQDGAFDSTQEAVIIRLVERPLETLEVGVGANSEFGLHTFGEAVNKSLFADGRSLSLRVDTYFDQAQINPNGSGAISQGFTSLRYVDPTVFDSEYTFTEELRYQRQELTTQEFNIDRVLFGSYLFKQYDYGLTLSAGHSILWDNLFDVNPGAIISPLDDGHVRLSFLSSIMKLDKRDDSILPRRGYTVSLEPKLSLVGIGSEANFASAIARSTKTVPLDFISPRYSLGLGLSGGLSQPWGDTSEIPITQRFYLGGRTTVRGFRENSLGPLGSDGAVIGGDTMLNGKNQFQYLVADSFSTHTFFDWGTVWLRHREFDLSAIRTSVGIGFQYRSPIGPIGLDVGYPLKLYEGEPSYRVHFSVGSMF
jgi:outer membrane protein insertion porin family